MSEKTIHSVGIIMNGVTGRMGLNQHLRRSIYAIMQQGGVKLSRQRSHHAEADSGGPQSRQAGGDQRRMRRHPLDHQSRQRPGEPGLHRSTSTRRRPTAAPPTSRRPSPPARTSTARSRVRQPRRRAGTAIASPRQAGVKHGVVQDKLWLPGMLKLKNSDERSASSAASSACAASSAIGFSRATRSPSQRPSWNYRKEDGGGIIIDMLCHWRYVLDNLFGPVKAVSCLGATHIPDTLGRSTASPTTAPPTIRPTPRSTRGKAAASWRTSIRPGRPRAPRRSADDPGGWHQGYRGRRPAPLLDAALRQHAAPRLESRRGQPAELFRRLAEGPRAGTFDNAFKRQWELFLRHVVKDEPFRWGLLEGAKGVQLAEKGLESWQKRAWVPVPKLQS